MWMWLTLVALYFGGASLRSRWRDLSGWTRATAVVGLCGLAIAGASTLPPGIGLGKVLGTLVMPLGLIWLFLFVATLHLARRRRWRAFAASAAAYVGLTLAGSPVLGGEWIARLEDPYWDSPFEQGRFDLVIVLGGATRSAPWPGYHLNHAGDRVFLAYRMYQRGLVDHLGSAGVPLYGMGTGHAPSRATEALWLELGIPAASILRLDAGRNTAEEAAAWARVVRERGFRRVGLVTSAWHMRRAEARFLDAGLAVVPLAADFRGIRGWAGFHGLIPSQLGARLVGLAAWEQLGAWLGR